MNNDSTERLPNEQDEYDTKPGITAVLERINALDEKWENRFAAFETKQEARHQEVLGQLRKLNQQFELVAIDETTARAELRDHRRRIEQLEEQQPAIK